MKLMCKSSHVSAAFPGERCGRAVNRRSMLCAMRSLATPVAPLVWVHGLMQPEHLILCHNPLLLQGESYNYVVFGEGRTFDIMCTWIGECLANV